MNFRNSIGSKKKPKCATHLGAHLSVFLALQGGKNLKVFLGYTVSWMEASPGYMRLRLKTTTQTNRKIPSVLRTLFCRSLSAVVLKTGLFPDCHPL